MGEKRKKIFTGEQGTAIKDFLEKEGHEIVLSEDLNESMDILVGGSERKVSFEKKEDPLEFIKNGGQGVLDPRLLEQEVSLFFLKRQFQNDSSLHPELILDKNETTNFSLKVTDAFSIGYFSDLISDHGFREGFNFIGIRQYSISVLTYLTYLLKGKTSEIPFEIDFGFSSDNFYLQVHTKINDFYVESLFDSMNKLDSDNPFSSLLTLAFNSSDYLDIFKTNNTERLCLSACWIKNKEKDFVKSISIHEISSFGENVKNEDVDQEKIQLLKKSMNNDLTDASLPGGAPQSGEDKEKSHDKKIALKQAVELIKLKHKDNDEFSLDDLNKFISESGEYDLFSKIDDHDREKIVDYLQDDAGLEELHKEVDLVKGSIDEDDYFNSILDSLNEIDDEYIQKIRGDISGFEESVLVKGTPEKLSEKSVVKGKHEESNGEESTLVKGERVSWENDASLIKGSKVESEGHTLVKGEKVNWDDKISLVKGSTQEDGERIIVKEGLAGNEKSEKRIISSKTINKEEQIENITHDEIVSEQKSELNTNDIDTLSRNNLRDNNTNQEKNSEFETSGNEKLERKSSSQNVKGSRNVSGIESESEKSSLIRGEKESYEEGSTRVKGTKEDNIEEKSLIKGDVEDLSEQSSLIKGEREDLTPETWKLKRSEIVEKVKGKLNDLRGQGRDFSEIDQEIKNILSEEFNASREQTDHLVSKISDTVASNIVTKGKESSQQEIKDRIEIEKLKGDLDKRNDQLMRTKRLIDSMKGQISTLRGKSQESIEDSQDDKSKLKTATKTLEREKEKLEKDLATSQKEGLLWKRKYTEAFDQDRESSESLHLGLADTEQNEDDLRSSVKLLSREKEKFENALAKKEKELNIWKKKYTEAFAQEQNNDESLHSELLGSEKNEDDLKASVAILSREKEKSENALAKLEKELSIWKRKYEESTQSKAEDRTGSPVELEKENKSLSIKVEQLEKRISSLNEKENSFLEEDISLVSKMKSNLQEGLNKIRSLENEKETYERQVKLLKRQIETQASELVKSKEANKEKPVIRPDSIESKEKEIIELQKEKRESADMNKALSLKIKSLEQRMKFMSASQDKKRPMMEQGSGKPLEGGAPLGANDQKVLKKLKQSEKQSERMALAMKKVSDDLATKKTELHKQGLENRSLTLKVKELEKKLMQKTKKNVA